MASSPELPQLPDIHVAAGVLRDAQGHVLIAQRTTGKAHAGAWEFPGGKLNNGEKPLAGLQRELREELGIEVVVARHLMRYSHSYPERRVHLYVWLVPAWQGQPQSLENQPLRWLEPVRLLAGGLLEADAAIALKLQADLAVNTAPLEPALVAHTERLNK